MIVSVYLCSTLANFSILTRILLQLIPSLLLIRNDEYLAKQGLEVKDVVDSLDFIE